MASGNMLSSLPARYGRRGIRMLMGARTGTSRAARSDTLLPLASSARGFASVAAMQILPGMTWTRTSTRVGLRIGRTFASDAAADQTGAATDAGVATGSVRKVVVLGGNGFVGSHVCQELLSRSKVTPIEVVSVNRSGPPQNVEDWDPEGSVYWQSCDLLAVVDEDESMIESLSSILTGADGVISCVGAFGNSEYMERVCGDVTVAASRIAASTGVPNFAFVSASEYGGLPETLAPGYFAGKRKAEAAIAKTFPDSGLVVRPGAIGGNRYVSSLDRNVPVGCLLKPLELVTKFSPVTKLRQDVLPGFVGKLLTPPMDVEVLARLVVDGALGDRAGTFTVDEMLQL